MNVQEFQRITPIAGGALLFVALLTVLVALWTLRRGRRDTMFIFRRAKVQRGGRLLMLGMFMLFMSAVVCGSNAVIGFVVRRSETPIPVVLLEPSETATESPTNLPTQTELPTQPQTEIFTPTETQTPAPTMVIPTNAPLATDLPTETPTAPPSATPTPDPSQTIPDQSPVAAIAVTYTATQTATLTATPAKTITETAPELPSLTPSPELRLPVIQSSVTPPATARLQITALDTRVSGDSSPIAANKAFPAGFSRIYYFVTYSDMGPGMVWRGTLSQNGAVINKFERQWGRAINGVAYFFFASENGFQPGDYEIRLYFGANETPAAVMEFKVIPAQ